MRHRLHSRPGADLVLDQLIRALHTY
jgi:hypothetical protein